mmetsp:Transcript_7312/g.6471  ORF Transcript_7312/g.6471 Transcript_7312/m.6471 type:complete len:141 (+) Transcript_7312:687-1109(+)
MLNQVKRIHSLGRRHCKTNISHNQKEGIPLTEEDDLQIEKEVHSLKVKYKMKKPSQSSLKKLRKNKNLISSQISFKSICGNRSKISLRGKNTNNEYSTSFNDGSKTAKASAPLSSNRAKSAVQNIRSKKYRSIIENIMTR